MSYDYIIRYYGLEFAPGDPVIHTVTNRPGVVTRENKSQSHYVMVRFGGQRHSLPCHPEELERSRAALSGEDK